MLPPLASRVGITSVSLGIIRALERNGVSVRFLLESRHLRSITFCSRSLGNMLNRFTPGAMLVTSSEQLQSLL